MQTLPESTAIVRSGEIHVAGVCSPVLEAGPGDGDEAVVFVHGNPDSSRDWNDLLGRTGEFARAIAPDMPGFGQAGVSRSFDYTVAGYARHLGLMLDQLGVRRAHLVLHDFGGPWGLAWAAANPDRFASATLINTGAPRGYEWHKMAWLWRTPMVGELVQVLTTHSRFR